jgi:hypothetical protein
MTIRNILASLCAATFAFCIATAPAHAQATRTWVSGIGNDGNSCTRTSPCLTFARALTQTAASGEIDCLDSGGFGAVNIGKSVTINCEGAIGGVQAGNGATGITVNVTTNDVVYLRGLDIIGTSNGVSGISLVQAGVLHVEHCLIHNFHFGAASGIAVAATGQSRLFVSDSYITDNGNGILIRPTGSGLVNAVVKQVHLETNGIGLGVDATAGTGKVTLSLVDSVAAGNSSGSLGVAVVTNAAKGIANVMINRASLSSSLVGLRATGPKATVRIGNSDISGNATGVASVSGGILQSYGNNQLNGNNTDGTMTTIPTH